MGATITIDKSYFETLLRRAEFHVSGQDFTTPADIPTVNIPKVDHDNLRRMAYEYSRLRDALYGAGIARETLEVLIGGGQDTQEPANASYEDALGASDGRVAVNRVQDPSTGMISSFAKASGTPFDLRCATRSPLNRFSADRNNNLQQLRNTGYDDVYFPEDVEKDEGASFHTPNSERPLPPKLDQRTIIFRNLPDKTTHQDIVNVVRGGMLLDVYLRSQEKAANVSFVQGTAAQAFMAYVKRNDVYVQGRRLSFSWGDRQYVLPGHLANKIGIGATRNLVIRGINPSITEKRLREDLDHIHNLTIISISFNGGDVCLSLNSIRNSLFARTCMMSRASYKGLRIEWYSDECASPLPKLQDLPKKTNAASTRSRETPTINRFQMLDIDNDTIEDESSNAEEDDPTMTSGFSSLQTSRRTPWGVSTAAD